MIRLAAIDTYIIDVPTIRPHVLSMATMRSQSMVIVRAKTTDGIEGLGEGTTIGGLSYGDESPESIKLSIDTYLTPLLIGRDFLSIAAAMAPIRASVVGNNIAKCAIETALLDIVGKQSNLPASEFLSGGRVRAGFPVAWTLASGNTAKDIAEAEEMLALRRHNIFKLKIGKRAVREDVRHVAAIKAALGDRASIRVDVNQAWSETQADLGLGLLEDAGVDLVEQPMSRNALAGTVRVARRHGIPIMADESLKGPEDAYAIATAGAAKIFAIKISQSGGLFAAARVANIADAAGIGLYGGTMLEGGIGTAASAQLFATFQNLQWGTELFGPLLLTEELLSEPLVYKDFELIVPTGPGLGIGLDEDKVAFFRRDRDGGRSHVISKNVS